ncbi:M24 family metallopeptidase [Halomonas urumqiensis]|uniref:Aminopeptidase n=1 Tax=Halomonas urumqiensis TaxID=1684789 RepID=A0A2N7UH14_9GAMM|nr:Xaa-Pro peptidase family protein [Halomonas urumqiensis]PMR79756.1 aminopeptidase [Halomonas urumqiensis]PTB00959.1 aminopeptidase P family protein [Halomonas urumqiensis]GHE23010.1 aminopeptidase [Halomonas urumqiensis]
MSIVESEKLTDNEPDSIPVIPSAPVGNGDSIPTAFDPKQLRAGRLERLRAMMAEQGYAALVLFDPNNQRYATGSRNMFGYFLRNSTRYIYVPLEGPIILFEYPGSAHISTWLETIDESRTSKVVWSAVNQRDNLSSDPFGVEIAELIEEHGRGNRKVGLDRCALNLARSLEAQGLEVFDCMQDTLHCRRIKTPQEIACLAQSMAASEAAVAEVEAAIKPGVTENELFAILYGEVIRQGGEFIETRLLNSGPRTNPWFHEASDRVIRPGELVALDTDTIGCHGYYSDFSRTFHVGPGKPSAYQRELYRMAYDQVQHNMGLLRPGISYRELAETAWKIPERFLDRRYPSIIHGVGMHGETPLVAHHMDFDRFSKDGVLEPGMVVSVESYIGEVGAADGVKLEEEVLITDSGVEKLSRYPFNDALLGREF